MRHMFTRRCSIGLLVALLTVAIATPAAEVASASSGPAHAAKKKKKKHRKKSKGIPAFFSGTTSQGYGIRLTTRPAASRSLQEFGVEMTCSDGSKQVHGPFSLKLVITKAGAFSGSINTGPRNQVSVTGHITGNKATGDFQVTRPGPDTTPGSTCQAHVTFTATAK